MKFFVWKNQMQPQLRKERTYHYPRVEDYSWIECLIDDDRPAKIPSFGINVGYCVASKRV
jgi:hypothetical protein